MRALRLILRTLAAVAAAAGLACAVSAAAPGPVAYRGKGQGGVLFSHAGHASQGLVCADCHGDGSGSGRALFATRKQARIDLPAHDSDAGCFACHNGRRASRECRFCHRDV